VATESTIYYEQRAREYDRVYDKPERQPDLVMLRDRVAELLNGRNVLEIAAGTGWWTTAIASTARRVHGIDLATGPLEVARSRTYGCETTFEIGDADAAFIGFLWSHLSRDELTRHLIGLARRLPRGARVVAIDNRYVEGSSTPISRTDADGNTYQQRVLSSGATHEVVKNFWDADTLLQIVRASQVAESEASTDVELVDHFWLCHLEIGMPTS
jgi:SAM-dependent methyltransferase